jgi:nucleotide-binding universal stress UspA family protein
MKILIPVDGSPYSDAALAFVAARPFEAEQHPQIDLLNVQLPVPPRAGRAVGAEMVRAIHEAGSRKILKPAVELLQQVDLEPAWFYRVGDPGLEIAAWADEHGADLIVMGSHGHTAIKGLLFGSVAQKVLASTTVPLLALRSARAPRRASLRLGIALDGSEYGTAAVRYVLAHRGLFGNRATVTLINVSGEGERSESERVLSPAFDLLSKAGLETSARALSGNPAEELSRFAREASPDVLVMGSHGRGALTSALLGSVAWRVAATCATPLLLIRKP